MLLKLAELHMVQVDLQYEFKTHLFFSNVIESYDPITFRFQRVNR